MLTVLCSLFPTCTHIVLLSNPLLPLLSPCLSLPLPFPLSLLSLSSSLPTEDVQWLTESIQRDLLLGMKPKQQSSSPGVQAKQQNKFLWPNRVSTMSLFVRSIMDTVHGATPEIILRLYYNIMLKMSLVERVSMHSVTKVFS